MNSWRRLRNLLVYLAPEPSLASPRKYIAVLTALLAVAAIAGAVVLTPSHRSKPDVWENLRQRVSKRAQVDLFDHFSAGLDAWEPGENQASTWSYDKSGFVNVGRLSLFEPSVHLTNYDLDALVQIEAKGLGLAFRATSSQSFQVARLIVEGSGPMRSLAVQRYALISGPRLSPRPHQISIALSVRYAVPPAFGSPRRQLCAVPTRQAARFLVRSPALFRRRGPVLLAG